jgi:hypothetical protein
MRMGRYCRSGVGLSQEIDGDFSLWKEFVPELHGKIISNTGQNAEKMGFEISDSHFGRIASMAARRNELVSHIVFGGYKLFHSC